MILLLSQFCANALLRPRQKKINKLVLVWFGLEKIMSILVATITDGPKMAGIGHHKNSLN